MKKQYIAVFALLAATMISAASAQEGTPRVSLDNAKPPASEECRRLQDRIDELNRMDDERLARGGNNERQLSPVQTKEWISKERKDAQTKMFFAKCQ
ncbi:hypothetical protein ACIPF8_07850 [Collimonas sp. NPDC087041]|uniref:hypothetical protein n=1 Tax=Collimonas sp. NPDC087041 TaxID=3363960 RepID=UPI0038028981